MWHPFYIMNNSPYIRILKLINDEKTNYTIRIGDSCNRFLY